MLYILQDSAKASATVTTIASPINSTKQVIKAL